MAENGEPRPDPERLAHFRVIGRLGQGGMGVVYRAEDERLRRQVALKVLPEALARDEDRRKRFLREARSAASINHPNIAMVHEVDEADGHVFIAMELVEGETLRERLLRGPLEPSEALRVARGIARGLSRAHAKGVLHRDLKPDNVMLDADGEPKILDFGLAKLREPEAGLASSAVASGETESKLTLEGQLLGTPHYMSPEQADGLEVDARSDVFSCGVLLYEMCSGKRPFDANRLGELLAQIQRDRPPPVRSVAPRVPPALEAVVDKCLAKSPADRYASGRELAEALEAVASGAMARPEPPPPGRSWTALLVAAAVAVGAVAVWSAWSHRETTAASASAPASAASASADAASHGIVLTELPPPKTTSPEAARDFAQAMQAYRDMRWDAGRELLLKAVQLDPSFPAAHLYLGWLTGPSDEDTRGDLAIAAEGRALLSERDDAVLTAIQTLRVKDEVHSDEAWELMKKVVERFPLDAFVVGTQAWAGIGTSHEEEALQLLERSRWLDPKTGAWDWEIAVAKDGAGDLDGERVALDRCLNLSPSSTDCRDMLAEVDARLGRCDALDRDARAMIQYDPRSAEGYSLLASALTARGAPIESVRDAIRNVRERRYEPKFRDLWGLNDDVALDVLSGDFVSAIALFPKLDAFSATFTGEGYPAAIASRQAVVFEEAGQKDRALAVVDAFAKRLPALAPEGGGRPLILLERRRNGRLSDADFAAQQQAGLSEEMRTAPTKYANGLWFDYYAFPSETPADARSALDALASHSPLPPYVGSASQEELMGKLLLLAGRVDEAIPHLRRSVAACFGPDEAMDHQWAAELLGEALEAKGDKDGACTAYGEVLALWGNAKPRSVTADKARAHAKTLGCAN